LNTSKTTKLKNPVGVFRKPDTAFSGWVFTLSVFVILVVYPTLEDGMFTDGLLYASVSRNLAEGFGSLWNLHFTQTDFPRFSEQPPLGFLLQAGFFKLFGPDIYAERIYNILMAVLAIIGIRHLWILASDGIKKLSWLPVLAFFLMPVSFWAYANNVLETTMLVFDLAAVILMWHGIREKRHALLWLAGLVLAGASLVKGVQGLFPLTFPLLYTIYLKKDKPWLPGLKQTVFLLTGLLCVYIPLALHPESSASIQNYFLARYPKTFGGVHNTTGNHFFLLKELWLDILPALGLLVLLWVITRAKADKSRYPASRLLFSLALTGILPLLITLEQRGFYLLTALPYLAVALFLPQAASFQEWFNAYFKPTTYRILNVLALGMFLACSVFALSQMGKVKRDQILLYDIRQIGNFLPESSLILTSESLHRHWSMKGYFARFYHIAASHQAKDAQWFLQPKSEPLPLGYTETKLGLKEFRLSQKPAQVQP